MKKAIIIIGGLLVLALVIGIYLLTHQPLEYAKGDISLTQAKSLAVDSKPCAAKNKSLRISAAERNDIEMGAILHIVDVPAGTNVDVRISGVSGGQAYGSAIYPSDYGSYNFTLTKDRGLKPGVSPAMPWQVTSFKPCKL